ncbi:MAG: hypothetical protein KAR42_06360 [candidate division Zixibacteria bacterium]|nr:hypothetical protein [candidate division Zixibacteria bacterium]
MRPIRIIVLLSVLALIACSGSIQAQIIYGQPASGNSQITYTNWTITNDSGTESSISQFIFPVSGFVPLQDNLEMRFYAANTSHSAELAGQDNNLSGLSDIRLQFNKSFAADRYLLSLGINLPTGKKELNVDEEQTVMGMLAHNYLSFPIRRMGEGLGFNLLFGGATTKGNSRFGATATFQYYGKYTPFEGEGEYDPGEMFSLSVNADTKKEKVLYSASMVFSLYTDDKLEEKKTRKSATQFDILAGMEIPGDKSSFFGNVRLLFRGRNTNYDNEEIVNQLRLYGNEFVIGGGMRYRANKLWTIIPTVDLRMIGDNEFEDDENKVESSSIFGIGSSVSRAIGQNASARLGYKYYTGSADGGNFDISGYQITAGLMATF